MNVTYVPGTRIVRKAGTPSNNNPTNIDEEVDIAAAVAAAKTADTVVLCLGEGSYTEHPGNIADLTLPDIQLKLAEAIIATGKPVVLVLVEGRPRVISRIANKVGGIVLALKSRQRRRPSHGRCHLRRSQSERQTADHVSAFSRLFSDV